MTLSPSGSSVNLSTLRRWAARLKRRLLPTPEWVREKNQRDHAFDRQFNVDTSFTAMAVLAVEGDHRPYARDHLASDMNELEAALSSIREPARWTFVDLGSGKGRALVVASMRPFRRIVGVEFAPELHQVAARNVATFPPEHQKCRAIELVCGDAAAYELPAEDTVIFMYNPFGTEVMEKVVKRVQASLVAYPRELRVLYSNPLHPEAWFSAGFEIVEQRDNFMLLAPPARSKLRGA